MRWGPWFSRRRAGVRRDRAKPLRQHRVKALPPAGAQQCPQPHPNPDPNPKAPRSAGPWLSRAVLRGWSLTRAPARRGDAAAAPGGDTPSRIPAPSEGTGGDSTTPKPSPCEPILHPVPRNLPGMEPSCRHGTRVVPKFSPRSHRLVLPHEVFTQGLVSGLGFFGAGLPQ